MEKLSKTDIQSIDTYLENSDIIYADIRMEMVDHVASAIEDKMNNGDNGAFYYIFKDYMVDNKAALLSDNKKFIKLADKKISRLLFINLFSIYTLLVLSAVFISFSFALHYFGIGFIKSFVVFFPLSSIMFFVITYWIVVNVFNLNRYSAVERLAFVFFAAIQIPNLLLICVKKLENYEHNGFVIIFILSIAFTLLILLFKTTFNILFKHYSRFKETPVL